MSTEVGLHPTKNWFHENAQEIVPVVQQPNLPQPGHFKSLFAEQASKGLTPQELGVDIQSEIDIESQRVLNNTIQVSQNLQDVPKGVSVEPTNQQSDLCFGISSVLGVTKEALGISDPDQGEVPMVPGFDPQNSPALQADMTFRPRGGMFG